jgi:hypothetical protein
MSPTQTFGSPVDILCMSSKKESIMPSRHTAASPSLTVYASAVGMMVAVALLIVGVSDAVWFLALP